MKRKILLINPPGGLFVRDDRCQSNVDEFLVAVPRPPHELLIMATILQSKGHTVTIRDYPIEKKSNDDYQGDIASILPDVLVINATLPTLAADLVCAQYAKKTKHDMIVVLRCGMIEYCGEAAMEREKAIDLILYGESDFTLSEFLECLDKNNVKGIFYRSSGTIVKTKPRLFIDNLDMLPVVNRDLIRNELYIRPDTHRPLGLIEVSRGCPYSCVFCLSPLAYGKPHRRRSIQNIIKEIKICTERYGVYDFHFKSDLFSFDHDWVTALCQNIIKHDLRIQWFANSRVDTVNEDMLAIMKESGCFALSFGVESGSQHILDKIRKNTSLEKARKSFELCKTQGIRTYAYFIIGFPWDTKDTIDEAIHFSKEIDPDFVDFFFPYAFPGTELYKEVHDGGLIDDSSFLNADRHSYSGVQFPTHVLSRNDLVNLRRKALRSFYFRPFYIIKVLKRCESIKEQLLVLKYGMSSLKKIGM